ncbi:unnamed protein product [Heterobilharzia americana]|nr:unnamed protein product [Heterobilharzia americana]
MQMPGEHNSCGYGVLSSGFSYDPVRFMRKNTGMSYFTPRLSVFKVIQFAIIKGKVVVHCHAGLGRTGVIIACYLVFNNRISAAEAIRYVRFRRPGSIQTQSQVESIYQFEKFLYLYRINFGSYEQFSLCIFLQRQNALFHGQERRRLRNVPKIVYTCCKLLVRYSFTGCTSAPINSTDIRQVVRHKENGQLSERTSMILFPPSKICANNQVDQENTLTNTKASCTYENHSSNENNTYIPLVGAQSVIEALLTTQYPESVVNETEYWKRRFNNDPEVWDDFDRNLISPLVLVKLVNDWLEHLKCPVLRIQDLLSLQQNPLFEEDILQSLESLEKPVVCLMSLFARLIINLQPMSEATESLLIQRILNWLCQKQSKHYIYHQSSSLSVLPTSSPRTTTITTTTKMDENRLNNEIRHHTKFDNLMQTAIKIMRFLIDFVKPNCTSVEQSYFISSKSSSSLSINR